MNYDCKLTGMVDGMLLYAKTQEEVVPDGKVNYNTGNTIYVKTLDLNQKFEGIKAQLDKLTLSTILCKCKQDSVVSYFLYLDSVFKN